MFVLNNGFSQVVFNKWLFNAVGVIDILSKQMVTIGSVVVAVEG